MEFIENNNKRLEMADMVHWTTGALNYTKKYVGHHLYGNQIDGYDYEKLYNACVDDDFVKLSAMYGEKEEALLSKIAYHKFCKLGYDCVDNEEVFDFVDNMNRNVVRKKLKELAPDVKRFTHALDEEQEKELEQEVEEQTQIEPPPDAHPADPNFDKRLVELVLNGIGRTFHDMKADGALLSIAASLMNTQMLKFCKNNNDGWTHNMFVTKDFQTVVDTQSQVFLRPVSWIACIKSPASKDILIMLSSYECNCLLSAFRKSSNSTLFMYRPRLSSFHSNLLNESKLQLTGMSTTNAIDAKDAAQVGVFAGSMYFENEIEQNAYCGFLGLIPKPWTSEVEDASKEGVFDDNCFVYKRKRNHPEIISKCVGQCKFESNPIQMAIALIKFHHQSLLKKSHVDYILNRGIKPLRDGDDGMQMDIE